MSRINIGANTFVYPNPVTLLGVLADGKPNFMALGWISRVNATPPLLGVGISKGHHSSRGITQNKTFSINYPCADMVALADYCGIVSGKKVDKSVLFDVFYGELKTAPMIRECPLSLECQLVDSMEFATNTWFVGEIVNTYAEESCLVDGKPDITRINPLLLTMPDNNYWTVGTHVGKAWSIGKTFKKAGRTEALKASITPEELKELLAAGDVILIDVRRQADFDADPALIPGATWRNPERVEAWCRELPQGKPVTVYCVKGGMVSQSTAEALRKGNVQATFVEGGLKAWKEAGGKVD
jgi:flavin reductase (DIM6/NTAB) family NADH-FMN oxidoreductase RutF/rhodanese-related sulfurtransferase